MFRKTVLQSFLMSIMLLAALVAGGCSTAKVTTYRATAENTSGLTTAQARELLINAPPDYCLEPRRVTYTAFKCGPNVYLFSELPLFVAFFRGEPRGDAYVSITGEPGSYHFKWTGPYAHANALDFVRGWYVMAHGAGVDPAQEAAFASVAQSYRSVSVKPQLSEDVVRYKVKAESAVRQKHFDEAVDLYEQALAIAPWWPQGHYNRGLILGEIGVYKEAVAELQRYLKLEPDAANARPVQLKIYEWEDMKK